MDREQETATPETAVETPSGDGRPETGEEGLVEAALKSLDDLGPAPDAEAPAEGEDAEGEADGEDAGEAGEEAPGDAGQQRPEETAKGPDKGDGDNWLSSKEFAALPPKAQARIRELTRKEREGREKVESLTPMAEGMTRLVDYCSEHGITNDEFTELMDFGAALKSGDFARAYEILQPRLTVLQEAVGATLPADLREAVDVGDMTEERAKAIAKERASAKSTEIRAQRAEGRLQQESQQRERQQTLAAIQNAVADEVAALAREDRGYQDISADVVTEIQRLRSLGVTANTEEQARKIVREAHRIVRSRTPSPKPTIPRPGSNTSTPRTSRNVDPRTVSDMDVAMDALRSFRG